MDPSGRTDYHAERALPAQAGPGGSRTPYRSRPERHGPRAMTLQRLLTGVVDFSRRNASAVFIASLVLAGFAGWFASGHLGVSTDTDQMFSASLPWRQRVAMMNRDFPQFTSLLVVVIDAREPEEAEATAASLAETLAADHEHFRTVRRPDASPFLDKEGLLFLDQKTLGNLLDNTIDAQPFIGQLVADPSARGLFSALSLLGMGVEQGQADLTPYSSALKGFHDVMADAFAGHPQPLSWAKLLGGAATDLAGKYKFVLVQPHLDFGALQPGGAATAALRQAAAQLEFVRNGDARVRITGSVALADEEFSTVAEGVVQGLIASILLITLWLFLAVRTWRLIVPILLTLLLGLSLTLLFAAAAVGTLNLVSVGFGILFVGIAVDFAIQFSVRYRGMRTRHADPDVAMTETGRRVGGQILVAAAATATGFLAFVPTAFEGVAELGMIAGAGMLIAFICTMVFLPAAITLFRPSERAVSVVFSWAGPLDATLSRHRRPILALFGLVALAGAVLLPHLAFDADPLHTKNPHTEAMETLYDLMDSPLTNPFTIDILTPNAEAAGKLAGQLGKLSLVDSVITVNSFVPTDQPAKLALIADAANILGPTLLPHEPAAPVTPDQIRMAAKSALDQIQRALP